MTGNTPDATILELAVAQNPTFFTADLIGGNDVLGYATRGGDATVSAITPPAEFATTFNTIIDGLTANGAKGAVTNIPYVNNLPYFTTVGYNPVPLDAATAGQLNAGYAAYNAGIQQAFAFLVATTPMTQEMADAEIAIRTITFAEGQNAVVIMDEYLTDLSAINPALVSLRQTNPADLITLPTASILATGAGTATPLLDGNVLTADEQLEIKNAVDAYNSTIQSVATAKGLAYVDVNQILIDAASTGITFDEYFLNADLVFGGLVSLDGIHLTARGYAYMANAFLEAIDDTYGSNFEVSGNFAKAGNYPTNFSPALR
jgi:lysophospholipase L1-like esterase